MPADTSHDYPGTGPRKAEQVASKDDKPEATHDLLLADGSTVESSGGIPTHIAVGDRVVRVLSATERQQ